MRGQTIVRLVAIAVVLISASIPAFAETYTYTTIDDPLGVDGNETDGMSGNYIIGNYNDASNNLHGYEYNIATSAYMTITPPTATGSTAYGIDGNNVVGAYGDGSGNVYGYVYNIATESYMTIIDPVAPTDSEARGISGSIIVGDYGDSTGYHGYFYNGSTFTTLDDPDGLPGYTIPQGVFGDDIVGVYHDPSGSGTDGFVYNILTATWTTIDDPFGVARTNAYGISGNNIVGYYADVSGLIHGFLYNGSTYATIDDPLGVSGTVGRGVSGDDILGDYGDAAGLSHGFLAVAVPEPSTFVTLLSAIGVIVLLLGWRKQPMFLFR